MSEAWLVTCPECATRFRVVPGQLTVADGRVRCGACLAVFRATERLEPIELAGQGGGAGQTPGTTEELARSHRHRSVLNAQAPLPAAAEAWPESPPRTAPMAFDLPVPPTLEVASATPRRRWPWLLTALLGLLLAGVQIAYWRFDEHALDPRWRPYYAATCDWIGCTLPELREPESIRSRRLSIRPHPERADALLLEAVIENQADFPQPYPAIELQFADIRGRPLAARRFLPEEYLRGEVAPGSPMPVGRPVRIALAIESPGEEAVNYQMAFW